MSKLRGRWLYIGQLWIENKMQKMTLCTVVFCFQSMLVISKFRGRELCIRQSWIKNKVHRTPVMNLFVSDEVRLLMVGMTADTHTGSDSFRNVIQTFWMTFLIRWSARSRIWISSILREKKHIPISELWLTACDHEQEKICSLLA